MTFSPSPHQRCAAQVLNLVASSVVFKLPRMTDSAELCCCSKVSNDLGMELVAARSANMLFDENCGRVWSVVPNATRWKSFYNSVDQITGLLQSARSEITLRIFSCTILVSVSVELIFIERYYCHLQLVCCVTCQEKRTCAQNT